MGWYNESSYDNANKFHLIGLWIQPMSVVASRQAKMGCQLDFALGLQPITWYPRWMPHKAWTCLLLKR